MDSVSGHGVQCREEVRAVIRDSQNTPGRVILCLNGHYHRSGLDIIDGVAFLDVNSASFNWVPKPLISSRKNGINNTNASATR